MKIDKLIILSLFIISINAVPRAELVKEILESKTIELEEIPKESLKETMAATLDFVKTAKILENIYLN